MLLLATKDVIAYFRRAGRMGIATGAQLLATVPVVLIVPMRLPPECLDNRWSACVSATPLSSAR